MLGRHNYSPPAVRHLNGWPLTCCSSLLQPTVSWWAPCAARADEAFARGAPDSAVACLERCVQEPPAEDDRADVLFRLGAAAQLLDAAQSADHLIAALAVTDDPKCKAAIAEVLGITLFNA